MRRRALHLIFSYGIRTTPQRLIKKKKQQCAKQTASAFTSTTSFIEDDHEEEIGSAWGKIKKNNFEM